MRGTAIALANDFDLKINTQRGADGKVVKGLILEETLPQNQAIILKMQPGELKEVPYLGCGIDDISLDNDLLEWRRKIRMQLELDGQTVENVKFTNSKLLIDASY